jgi:hypothetical protein
MLKAKDLASVASKLQIPVIVSDLLQGIEPITDDAEYALHETISDMQPDSALLCIAFCGAKIAGVRGLAAPPVRILEMECRKIIEEYAMLWLKNAETGEVDEAQALETLSGAAEDLEDLAGLLENCMTYLGRTNGDAAIICDILSIQARAHALVAEAYFDAIGGTESVVEDVIAGQAMADNVIPFPSKRA